MLFGLLLTLGVGVLRVILSSYQTSFAQKAGALGILIASFLAVYFITGSIAWGTAGAASRLFYKGDDRAQATICLNEQHDLSFYYLRISSRAKNGLIWTTWNYPLSYGLKLTPQYRINRQRADQSFWQLYQSHRDFLRRNRVETIGLDALDDEAVQSAIESDLREQIAHNVGAGVLKPAEGNEVKYSWRGMIYLWCQFLLDLVRL